MKQERRGDVVEEDVGEEDDYKWEGLLVWLVWLAIVSFVGFVGFVIVVVLLLW